MAAGKGKKKNVRDAAANADCIIGSPVASRGRTEGAEEETGTNDDEVRR